jgi:hypothetical protein
MNAMGTRNPRAAEGSVGNFSGLRAADANIPANLGAGTNEDRMIIGRFDEMYLREGTPLIRVLQEVLSGTLQVRFQLISSYPPRPPAPLRPAAPAEPPSVHRIPERRVGIGGAKPAETLHHTPTRTLVASTKTRCRQAVYRPSDIGHARADVRTAKTHLGRSSMKGRGRSRACCCCFSLGFRRVLGRRVCGVGGQGWP